MYISKSTDQSNACVYRSTFTLAISMYTSTKLCICIHVHTGMHVHTDTKLPSIRESVDSLCRDGADMPIVRVHTKAF